MFVVGFVFWQVKSFSPLPRDFGEDEFVRKDAGGRRGAGDGNLEGRGVGGGCCRDGGLRFARLVPFGRQFLSRPFEVGENGAEAGFETTEFFKGAD